MNDEIDMVIRILSAFAIGFFIGTERGWKGKMEADGARIGGIRTFTLIGIFGGICGLLHERTGEWVLVAGFLAMTAMTVTSYLVDTRNSNDIGTTTAYTKLITFGLGAWAALGYYMYALGTTVGVIAILGTKPELHRWLRGMEAHEIRAGIKMLAISLVMLPLLPDQGYGPWEAINPRWIWWMVVLISGISFIGYFAVKYIDDRKGILVTSLTGGLASSTAVTLSMAGFARSQKGQSIFMAGVMLASTIMPFRVMVEVAIVNLPLLGRLWIPLVVLAASVLAGGLWLWGRQNVQAEPIELENPLNIVRALKFGAFLALILFLGTATQEFLGDRGVYVLSVLSGVMDVNAITLSLSRLSLYEISDRTAVYGIILAAATNTISKGVMFAFFAGFRQSLRLILLMAAAAIMGLATAAVVVL